MVTRTPERRLDVVLPESSIAVEAETTDRGGRVRRDWPVLVSWLLAALLAAACLYGLLVGDAYRVARDIEVQGFAQDALTLLTIPVLLWSAHRSRAASLRGHVVWLGVLAYLVYAYATYTFAIPHNDVFLLYTTILGLSTAALLDGLARIDVAALAPAVRGLRTRGVGWFLVLSGLAFGLLWLGDIVPAIGGAAPPEGVEANGMPNPVYALDLAFAIPAVVASGVMLLRRHPAGPLVAAVVLLKIVTLGLSVEAMGAWMVTDGHPWDAPVGILFAMLIVVSAVVLARWSGRLQPPSPGWLRRSPWR